MDPDHSADSPVGNFVTLRRIFQFLKVIDLKEARQVNRTWNAVGALELYRKSRVHLLHDDESNTRGVYEHIHRCLHLPVYSGQILKGKEKKYISSFLSSFDVQELKPAIPTYRSFFLEIMLSSSTALNFLKSTWSCQIYDLTITGLGAKACDLFLEDLLSAFPSLEVFSIMCFFRGDEGQDATSQSQLEKSADLIQSNAIAVLKQNLTPKVSSSETLKLKSFSWSRVGNIKTWDFLKRCRKLEVVSLDHRNVLDLKRNLESIIGGTKIFLRNIQIRLLFSYSGKEFPAVLISEDNEWLSNAHEIHLDIANLINSSKHLQKLTLHLHGPWIITRRILEKLDGFPETLELVFKSNPSINEARRPLDEMEPGNRNEALCNAPEYILGIFLNPKCSNLTNLSICIKIDERLENYRPLQCSSYLDVLSNVRLVKISLFNNRNSYTDSAFIVSLLQDLPMCFPQTVSLYIDCRHIRIWNSILESCKRFTKLKFLRIHIAMIHRDCFFIHETKQVGSVCRRCQTVITTDEFKFRHTTFDPLALVQCKGLIAVEMSLYEAFETHMTSEEQSWSNWLLEGISTRISWLKKLSISENMLPYFDFSLQKNLPKIDPNLIDPRTGEFYTLPDLCLLSPAEFVSFCNNCNPKLHYDLTDSDSSDTDAD